LWHLQEFNDNTHVVAIKNSGNVYAMDAVNELNIKPKNWTDLMTGEPFTRKDVGSWRADARLWKNTVSRFSELQSPR
jgi:peptidyl-prolyl cis-trans isomerase-like protein 2